MVVVISVGGAAILARWGVPLPLCVFKTATGWPCFTCGTTRALLALAEFDLLQALRWNPAATFVALAMPTWWLASGISARIGRQSRRRTPWLTGKRFALGVAILGLGNWAYLLATLPR